MNRFWWLICLFISVGTVSCAEEEKTWTVTYRVDVQGGSATKFRVRYLTQSQATREVGPFNVYWESPALTEFKDGENVRLTVERISGDATLNLAILRNGAVHESGQMVSSENEVEIEDQL